MARGAGRRANGDRPDGGEQRSHSGTPQRAQEGRPAAAGSMSTAGAAGGAGARDRGAAAAAAGSPARGRRAPGQRRGRSTVGCGWEPAGAAGGPRPGDRSRAQAAADGAAGRHHACTEPSKPRRHGRPRGWRSSWRSPGAWRRACGSAAASAIMGSSSSREERIRSSRERAPRAACGRAPPRESRAAPASWQLDRHAWSSRTWSSSATRAASSISSGVPGYQPSRTSLEALVKRWVMNSAVRSSAGTSARAAAASANKAS